MQLVKGTSATLAVAVDLLPLRPGGENGGIKPAIFGLLRELARQGGDSLFFVFFTNSASHAQVREISRPNDLLICVLEDPLYPGKEIGLDGSTEFKLMPPPLELLRAIEIDLLYCPFGATTFDARGIPTIALIADLLHRDYPFTLTERQIAEREAYIEKTIKVATKIQCISRSGMERLKRHYGIGSTSAFYTYLPIHDRSDEPPNELTVQRVKESSQRQYFFYPANLWLHKNHEVLLLAFAMYRHRTTAEGWDLLLTFHEDARADAIKSLAKTLNISQFIDFAGYVSESELHRIWKNAGALVFPSLHEGLGIPIIEAMHYGVPIITGEDFSLKEIAGDACYVIDSRKPASIAQALHEISENKSLRQSLVHQGSQRLKLFDLAVETKRLLDVFRSITREKSTFPRLPNFLQQPGVIAIGTPASDQIWTIEVQTAAKARGRYAVYLEDSPYGTFYTEDYPQGLFAFDCRPLGRTLGLLFKANESNGHDPQCSRDPVGKIVARSSEGDELLLFKSDDAPAP